MILSRTKIFIVIIFTISFVFPAASHVLTDSTYKEYYSSGKLKSIRHQGNFNGCGMPVGTDSLFYESGKLKQIIRYDNRINKKDPGCHSTFTTAFSTIFYPAGKKKTFTATKYFYEGESCNCGTWLWFNKEGKPVKKKKYSNCYDQVF